MGTTMGVIVGGVAINKFGYVGLGFATGISAFIAMLLICSVIKSKPEESGLNVSTKATV